MLLCCKTYNIHDSQDVLLDVSATMVAHHHLVGYHQRLHVALTANWALQRQLATANVVGRRLQSSLPPWCTFHRLLIWGTLRTTHILEESKEIHKSTAAANYTLKTELLDCTFHICQNWPTDDHLKHFHKLKDAWTWHEYRAWSAFQSMVLWTYLCFCSNAL